MKLQTILNKNNNNFDLLRLILAYLVIYSHSIALLNTPLFLSNKSSDFFLRLTHIEDSGSIAVKCFFFISGLFVSNSLRKKQSIKNYIIARIFRIIPAYYIVVLLTFFVIGPILTNLTLYQYFTSTDTLNYLYNLVFYFQSTIPNLFDWKYFFGIVNGNLWTLPFEVFCYFSLIILFIIKKKTIILWGILLFLILIDPLFHNSILIRFYQNEPIHFTFLIPSFFIGVLTSYLSTKININLYTGAFLFALYFIMKNSVANYYFFYLFVFWFILYFFSLPLITKIKLKADISYGVYLYSCLVQQILIKFCTQDTLSLTLTSIIISSFIGIISWFLIEKKAVAYGNKIRAKLIDGQESFIK